MSGVKGQETHTDKCTKWQRLLPRLHLVAADRTPMKWEPTIINLLGMFACSISVTFVFPILPVMSLHFGYKEEDKGYYTGLIASSVFVGRVLTCYFWGWLSDRKGRKPVFLICLFGLLVTNITFGLSNSLGTAIVLRLISGMFHGIIGIAKTITYELSDDSNHALAMSTIGVAWGAGLILGPLVAGYLAEPAKQYPQLVPEGTLFANFPFLLPCIAIGIINGISLILVWWRLPETLTTSKCILDVSVDAETSSVKQETAILLTDGDANLNVDQSNKKAVSNRRCTSLACLTQPVHLIPQFASFGDLSVPPPQTQCQPHARLSQSAPVVFKQSGMEKKREDIVKRNRIGKFVHCVKDSRLYTMFSMKDARFVLFLYMLFSFGTIGWDEVFVVWTSTEIRLNGLGFHPDQIGNAIGISAIPLLFVQFFIFPFFEKRIGSKKTFLYFCAPLIFIVSVIASLRILNDRQVLLWSVMLVLLMFHKMMTVVCFSAISVLTNNSVPVGHIGSLNGLAVTMSAIGRAGSPMIGGSLFAWSLKTGPKLGFPFDVNLTFFMFGVVYLANNILCSALNDRLNHKCVEEKNS